MQARANARLGLHIALAELQAAAGPDQRSVARAGLMVKHDGVSGPGTPFPEVINALDSRSFWTGVSHSDGSSNIGSTNKPVIWLVSGLNPGLTSEEQLNSVSSQPVNLNPVDLITVRQDVNPNSAPAITLRAGRVDILAPDNSLRGRYAWVIDDESQKAKLATVSDISNSNSITGMAAQSTVLPGLADLRSVTALNSSQADLLRATRLQDVLINHPGDANVVNSRFFDYTLNGFGVLADTRNGGLKRDLTAAYENPAVFSHLFPNQTRPPYITIDQDKFDDTAAQDLRNNGYIHHGIFRDYYNLKDRVGAGNSIRMNVIDKATIDNNASVTGMRTGTLGPHQMNYRNHPYGEFDIWSGTGNPSDAGAHNPITPVLAYMQQNVWIEAVDIVYNIGGDNPFMNYSQLWTGVYNPYNVSLEISSINGTRGPMFRGFLMPRAIPVNRTDGSVALISAGTSENYRIINNRRWIFANEPTVLAPGNTQVFGFDSSLSMQQARGGSQGRFTKNIASSVNEAAFVPRALPQPGGGVEYPIDLLVEMSFIDSSNMNNPTATWNGPSLAWGLPATTNDSNPQIHSGHEIAQVFYVPFSADRIRQDSYTIEGHAIDKSSFFNTVDSPGVEFYRTNLFWSDIQGRMFPSDEAVYEFRLRITNEPSSQGRIRPLIDSNIRAIWNNPKWDTGLGLNSIGTHTISTNKSDDPTASSVDVFNNGSPLQGITGGNEAFLSYGNSQDVQGSQQVILFDIPRQPLVSIGQLQHAAAGRFSYEPSYIVGNSYANIRLPLHAWFRTDASDTYSSQHNGIFGITGNFSLFDASYLVNEALFD
jgi:hypothetical protein